MSKLKLDLDDLRVDTFATEPFGGEGTVQGHHGSRPMTDCGGCPEKTQANTCGFSCGAPTCSARDANCGGTRNWCR